MQRKYENFQNKNLGGFEKIYPLTTKVDRDAQDGEPATTLNDVYAQIKSHSIDLHTNQFGVRKATKPIDKSPEQMTTSPGIEPKPKFISSLDNHTFSEGQYVVSEGTLPSIGNVNEMRGSKPNLQLTV